MSFPRIYRETMKDRLHNIASMLGTSIADAVTRCAGITLNDSMRINTTYLIKSDNNMELIEKDIRDTVHAVVKMVQALPQEDLYTALFIRPPKPEHKDTILAMEISDGRKLETAAWLGLVTAGTEDNPLICFGMEKPADLGWVMQEYELEKLLNMSEQK